MSGKNQLNLNLLLTNGTIFLGVYDIKNICHLRKL